jgi:hypothetical protein
VLQQVHNLPDLLVAEQIVPREHGRHADSMFDHVIVLTFGHIRRTAAEKLRGWWVLGFADLILLLGGTAVADRTPRSIHAGRSDQSLISVGFRICGLQGVPFD